MIEDITAQEFAQRVLEVFTEQREGKLPVTIPPGMYFYGDMVGWIEKLKDPWDGSPVFVSHGPGDAGFGVELITGENEYFETCGVIGLYPVTQQDLEDYPHLTINTMGMVITITEDVIAEYTFELDSYEPPSASYNIKEPGMGISLDIPGYGKLVLQNPPTDLEYCATHIEGTTLF